MVPVHEWFCAKRFICYSKSWMPFLTLPHTRAGMALQCSSLGFYGNRVHCGWLCSQLGDLAQWVAKLFSCCSRFTMGHERMPLNAKRAFFPPQEFLWLLKSDREVPWDPHPKLISYHETSNGMHVHECVVLFRCSYREITGLYLWSVVTASNKYPVLNPEDATLVWHGNEAGVIGSWNECYTLDWEWGWYSSWEWGLLMCRQICWLTLSLLGSMWVLCGVLCAYPTHIPSPHFGLLSSVC